MRLQKYMASCGVASRRKSEELIAQGIVTVNGEKVVSPGTVIDPEIDIIEVFGKRIKAETKHYYLFNKPSKVLCTAGEPRGRKTVYEYFNNIDERLFTVGRLDYNTSGLLIVTNDGDFANHITHPSHEKEKEYTVRINGFLSDEQIDKLENGVYIDGQKTSDAKVHLNKREEKSSSFNITIHEGRNRQIRKMVESIGHKTVFLQRIRIANLLISDIKEGEYRELTNEEINLLKN